MPTTDTTGHGGVLRAGCWGFAALQGPLYYALTAKLSVLCQFACRIGRHGNQSPGHTPTPPQFYRVGAVSLRSILAAVNGVTTPRDQKYS